MSLTLREMLNHVLEETGFRPYQTYFGNSKLDAQQLTALANREINELQKYPWQVLINHHQVPMQAGVYSYDLPSDYRQFVPDSAWSETRKANFPTSPNVWNYYVARAITNGMRHRVRLIDNKIEIQNPENGTPLQMEYVTKFTVKDSNDLLKERFTADDDSNILNDDLIMLGLKWRFLRAKGLEWQDDLGEYKRMVKMERGSDGSSQTIYDTSAGGYDYEPFEPRADLWVN